MTYTEAIKWMFNQLPMYQHQGKIAFKADLKNSETLARHLHHPEKKFNSIHVAGTNGKGSVCHMLASIFQEAGYKTGLHTSPHLKDFRERIRINGKMIPRERVLSFLNRNQTFFKKNELSFFEMSVGMAFHYFAEEDVDIVIIETGLGGRLDSTNIIRPELSIITNIGFDHTAILGDTLPKIAAEKAGIIKPHTPVVIGQKDKATIPVFQKKATEMEAALFFAEAYSFPSYLSDLKGIYQQQNRQTVSTAIRILQKNGWKITPKALERGFQNSIKNTGLRGRWEVLGEHPKIICDTAHNKEGLEQVLQQLLQEPYQVLHIVLGVVNDKDLRAILPLFPKKAQYYFCEAQIPRRLEVEILAQKAAAYGLRGKPFKRVEEAFQSAREKASEEDVIFVGGSTFTVAEVL